MAAGPAARSLAELRKQGYYAQVVERWIPMTRRRLDLYGFIDIVAIDSAGALPGVLAVQATSTSNMSARLQKICTECADEARAWLQTGNRIEIHGWAKRGAKGKRKLWTLRRHTVELPELEWRSVLQ